MTLPGVSVWLLGIVAVVALASLLHHEPPGSAVQIRPWQWTLPETCGSKRSLGLECPGCGLTRSFILSAHGQWATAFAVHPFGMLGFLGLVALIPVRLWQAVRLLTGKPALATGSAELTLLVGLAIGTIGWWIGKLLA